MLQPRGFHELETDDHVMEVSFVREDCEETDMDIDSVENVSYVREDCEGIFE